jgi:hypothetical protein
MATFFKNVFTAANPIPHSSSQELQSQISTEEAMRSLLFYHQERSLASDL